MQTHASLFHVGPEHLRLTVPVTCPTSRRVAVPVTRPTSRRLRLQAAGDRPPGLSTFPQALINYWKAKNTLRKMHTFLMTIGQACGLASERSSRRAVGAQARPGTHIRHGLVSGDDRCPARHSTLSPPRPTCSLATARVRPMLGPSLTGLPCGPPFPHNAQL